MRQYKIVGILWEDAVSAMHQTLPVDLDDYIPPSLTVGVLLKKTKRHVLVANHIERGAHGEPESDIFVILRSSILGITEYGEVELDIPS